MEIVAASSWKRCSHFVTPSLLGFNEKHLQPVNYLLDPILSHELDPQDAKGDLKGIGPSRDVLYRNGSFDTLKILFTRNCPMYIKQRPLDLLVEDEIQTIKMIYCFATVDVGIAANERAYFDTELKIY